MNQTPLFRVQLFMVMISAVLMVVKFTAYTLTSSNSILTDALESIINVAAGIFSLYSLILSAKPKDLDHPYGHGKIEFISASVEGSLILFAGILMVFKAGFNFIYPVTILRIDWGLYISVFTGLVNYGVGLYAMKNGRKSNSLVLESGGKHLLSDAYSTAGLVMGLAIVWYTGMNWLDNILAIILGIVVCASGYKIFRKSISGIMDETDYRMVAKIISILNAVRRIYWIDIHNMRIIKYGAKLHIDCHVTMPWYINVEESHAEIEAIEAIAAKDSGRSLEMFAHVDPCIKYSCKHCLISDCKVRQLTFESKLEWKLENVLPDRKHGVSLKNPFKL